MGHESPILSATSVIGNPVKNSNGEDLGKIEELIIDPDTGLIVGALLARQDSVRPGKQFAAGPWKAMNLSKKGGAILVDTNAMEPPQSREPERPGSNPPDHSHHVLVYTSTVYKPMGGDK